MAQQKRYQIFVSSTFQDLQEERQAVFRAIQKMGHIPAGMEHFPAFGAQQLAYIKTIIDKSDYYVVVVAGRYGSPTDDGMSYTEAEYDYAVEKGLTVIPMLHKNPGEILGKNIQMDAGAQERLEAFKKKLSTDRIYGSWETPHELAVEVMAALGEAFNAFPAVGWVRGNQAAQAEILSDLVKLEKDNKALRKRLSEAVPVISDLADLDEGFEVFFTRRTMPNLEVQVWSADFTWLQIFLHFAYATEALVEEEFIQTRLGEDLGSLVESNPDNGFFDRKMMNESFQQIARQMRALGLATVQMGERSRIWSLTPKGEALLFASRAIRTKKTLQHASPTAERTK